MEIISALWFYAVFSMFGLLGYGITVRLFETKFLAYITAKVCGLIVFGYGIWLLASLHLLNYQHTGTVTVLFGLACGIGLWSTYQHKQDTPTHSPAARVRWFERIWFWELMGLVLYCGYLYLRSHNAAINGTERFMDMAFLTASGKTDYFPPVDPWYATKTINYYYFGSYLMSLISNLSQIPYAVGYTAALGLIFSQSFITSSGLVYSLSRSRLASIWTGFMITTAGTLYFAGCSFSGYLRELSPVCSYASSTRLYTPSYIINEIPSYSFTVGDLHAHLLALPLFLGLIPVAYALSRSSRLSILGSVIASIGGAVLAMTNAWDAVTYFALLGVLGIIQVWQARAQWRAEAVRAVGRILGIGIPSGIWMLPFSLHFHSPVLGIGFAPAYTYLHHLSNVQYPTPFRALLGMWGGTLAICLLAWRRFQKSEHARFALALGIVSIGILVGVELFFIKDIYSVANPPYFRANTTFKFGYHAWSMLSILAGILAGTLLTTHSTAHARWTRTATLTALALVAGAGLVYPYQAIQQFYGYTPVRTLDGSAWLAQYHPDDYATIQYLNNTITGRPVIAEAVGDSYTEFGRMSVFSGLPTPMGWKTHEWTWRLQKPANPDLPNQETGWSAVAAVAGDMEQLYTTMDIAAARAIVAKYHISYIYVGDMERTMYPTLQTSTLSALATPVFQSGASTLFRIQP